MLRDLRFKIVEAIYNWSKKWLGIEVDWEALNSMQTENFNIVQYAREYSLSDYEHILLANDMGLGEIVTVSGSMEDPATPENWQDRVKNMQGMKDVMRDLTMKFSADITRHLDKVVQGDVRYDKFGRPRAIQLKLVMVKEKAPSENEA